MLRELEMRYDHLADIRRRADERYRTDYKKWKAVYVWLTSDGPDEDHPDVSFEDKKRLSKLNPTIARKRQAIIDGKINLSFVDNDPDGMHTNCLLVICSLFPQISQRPRIALLRWAELRCITLKKRRRLLRDVD